MPTSVFYLKRTDAGDVVEETEKVVIDNASDLQVFQPSS